MPARDGETERENFRPRGNERWFGRRGHAVAPLATPSTTRRAQWLDPYSGSPQHGPKKFEEEMVEGDHYPERRPLGRGGEGEFRGSRCDSRSRHVQAMS
jgi:hypothetical protein